MRARYRMTSTSPSCPRTCRRPAPYRPGPRVSRRVRTYGVGPRPNLQASAFVGWAVAQHSSAASAGQRLGRPAFLRQVVAEGMLDGRQMGAHRPEGAVAVAAYDGGDDLVVFGEGLGHAPQIAELGARERR